MILIAVGKRKAQEKKAGAFSDVVIKSEPLIECWDIKQESMSTIPASHATQLYSKRTPVLPSRPRRTQFNFVFPLSPDHLITLLQYNALRALAVNRTLISGILTTPLDCDVETFHVVPYPSNPESVPSALLPTILQQTIPHGDWVECSPAQRDEITLSVPLGPLMRMSCGMTALGVCMRVIRMMRWNGVV
jgi:hypothetical protein